MVSALWLPRVGTQNIGTDPNAGASLIVTYRKILIGAGTRY